MVSSFFVLFYLIKFLVWGFKGIVSVMLSDPPCKDGNARFSSSISLNNSSDQNCDRNE